MENHPPWSDLPCPALDQILDRLPLRDYIRFSTVCPRWRSVQIDHCRRSRLLSYPWLIPSNLKQDEDNPQKNQRNNEDDQEDAVIVPCYSPFDRRIYHLRNLPISSPFHFCCASSSHGWILLRQCNPSDIGTGNDRNILSFYFLNPISNLRISLPPIRLGFHSGYHVAISCSSCITALVVTSRQQLFLFREGDPDWITLPFSPRLFIREAKSCGEKFYCICSYSSIFVIDHRRHPTPLIEYFEMDVSQMLAPSSRDILLESGQDIYIESDRHILLVKVPFNLGEKFDIKGVQVFKADFSTKMWEPMECLDDRMLLLACYSSISLVADGIGGRRNCIYYSEGSIWNPFSSGFAELSAWKIFDLGSKSITDWPLLDTLSEGDCLKLKKYAWRLMVPSIARV